MISMKTKVPLRRLKVRIDFAEFSNLLLENNVFRGIGQFRIRTFSRLRRGNMWFLFALALILSLSSRQIFKVKTSIFE